MRPFPLSTEFLISSKLMVFSVPRLQATWTKLWKEHQQNNKKY